MSSKLVFLDIDGTLADERHEVPISAQEACKAARSRGHKLFICTGRSMPKIERGILDLGFDGVISVAGAQADVNGRVLFRHDIAPEAIDAATAYFERHGIENYQWQGADGMYISCGYARHLESKGSAVWKNGQFARYWHLIDDIAVPDGSTLGHVIHASKGSYFSGADPDVSFDDVSRDLGEWFTLVHGSYDDISPNNGELLINGVDKGTALCGVAKDLGYSNRDWRQRQRRRDAQGRGHVRGDGQRHSRHRVFLRHDHHRHPRRRYRQRLRHPRPDLIQRVAGRLLSCLPPLAG